MAGPAASILLAKPLPLRDEQLRSLRGLIEQRSTQSNNPADPSQRQFLSAARMMLTLACVTW